MADTQEPVIDFMLRDLTDDQILKLRQVWQEIDKLTDPSREDEETKKNRAGLSAEQVRESLWSNVKQEDPDQLLVRYLRFGHWKVADALKMTIQSMNWRRNNKVDDEIVRLGDAYYADLEKNGDTPDERKFGKEVMDQMRSGKSFLRGVDKEGRPLLFVRPRYHSRSAQSPKALERYIVYNNEIMRVCLRPPHTGVTAVLDLRGFSMANMDWQILKLGISELSIMYAEGLERLYIVHSPWIVSGIWWTVKGWLNPVIKERIHFLSTIQDLAPHIDLSQCPDDTGGTSGWNYEYVEPRGKPGPMREDAEKQAELMKERKTLLDAYEAQTRSLHDMTVEQMRASLPERRRLVEPIRENYWKLDPYVRGESLLDRVGIIAEDGSYHPWAWNPPK